MRTPNNDKKTEETIHPDERMLNYTFQDLMRDQRFPFGVSDTLLGLLTEHHKDLHADEYEKLFRLLGFLNHMEHVQKLRLMEV